VEVSASVGEYILSIYLPSVMHVVWVISHADREFSSAISEVSRLAAVAFPRGIHEITELGRIGN